MSKRSGEPVSNKFAMCGRASGVGTCADGSTQWWNLSAGTSRWSSWSIAATDRGTIRTVDHHTKTGVDESPVKCCVNHFSAICSTGPTNQKCGSESSNSSLWRRKPIPFYSRLPKVQSMQRTSVPPLRVGAVCLRARVLLVFSYWHVARYDQAGCQPLRWNWFGCRG